MADTTLRDKIRKRRQALQESLAQSDADPDISTSRMDDTWASNDVEAISPQQNGKVPAKEQEETTLEVLDEETEKENMLQDLASRRKTRQRELNKSLQGAVESVEDLDEVDSTARKMSMADAALSLTKTKSPTGLSSSVRERLKNKVKTVREKVESEAKEEPRPARKLRALRGRPPAITRFDKMNKEDLEAEKLLEASLSARSKWKKAGKGMKLANVELISARLFPCMVLSQDALPTDEEAYDFFTHVYDAEEEEEPPKPPTPREPEAGPSGEGEEEGEEAREEGETEPKEEGAAEQPQREADRRREEAEKAQEALEDYLSEGWQMTHVHAAQYTGYQARVDRERDIYFVPSMLPVPAEEKVPQDAQPRYLEDEGFYVGERPPVSYRNQNIAEDRLLKEPDDRGARWFGEDGKIIALPDPLKTEPTRPPNMLIDEPEPMLETEYRKAWLKEFDGKYIDGSEQISGHGRYQLDVDVNMLVFTHHSLFSREHVLAARLNQLYQQYLVRTHKNMANFLTDKLKALKAAANHLESQEGQGLNPTPAEQSGRLREYKNEIRQTRKLRDAEQQADRNLLKNILKVWRDIKALRQLQAFANTSAKLVVRKEETDKENDRVVWEQEVVEEVQEEEDAMEEEYRRQVERYKALMAEWKKQHKARKQKKKKKKKKEGSQESLQDSLQDESVDEGETLPKPEAPQPPDREGLREKVQQKALQIRRRPGEPILTPEVTNTATITPKQQCPRGEQERRQDVERLQVFVKVLFNDKEVSRTRPRSVTSDFKVTFGEIFPILIIQWPESIKLQVYEKGALSNTLLAEVYAGIPEAAVTSGNVELEDLEFSSDQRVAYDHEGVGSGVMFSFEEDNSEPLCLLTTAILSTSVSWGTRDDGTPLVPPVGPTTATIHSPMLQADPVAAIGATGMVDMEKLAAWIEESRLDPNDPSNAALMQHVKNFTGGKNGVSRLPDYFRLEQLQEEFNFATDEELEKSKRFRLLKLRSREVPEFRSYPMVPLRDREIPDSIFKVKEHVLNRYRMARHQFSTNDMVMEDQVPDIGTLTVTLLKITEPRRPLRPVRKERKKVPAQALSAGDVKILVNIQRAFNMQIRTGGAGSGGAGGASSVGDRTGDAQSGVLVRPFVEVTFQRTSQKTSTAEGINPSWNEELQLPLRVPNNDYSPSNLQTLDDTLFINVFDELVIDILEDDRQRGTDIHRRIERHWLGSIQVPFSTIYFQSQIDGTFRVEAPPVLLGYKRGGGGGSEGLDLQMGGNEHTYLTLFITIEPPLTPLEPLKEKFDSQEDEKLLFQAEKWQGEIEKRFPKRNISTTVTNINGKSVFVTRFIQPLRPPDELIDSNADTRQNSERVARFVSLIPFISDSTLFAGICDIWSTCDQFLQMLSGDEEEHAVLLCNYFLHMGKKAWVVLGSAVPEGPTAYVLTHESSGDYLLWNPSSGEFFNQHDPFCPMQSVGCLINQDNIWANVQGYDATGRMSFDTTREAQWKPFFSRSYPNPGLSSVQPDQLVYLPTDKDYVADLQDRIERKLRDKVMEWRPHSITRWNRYCTQIFRRLLPRLEQSGGRGTADEHRTELEPILASYKMSGFPMQMPYTEDNPVVEAVFSTGVHQLQGKDVEFALAVHIHPYPNSVLSLWVYVASLVRKR
ncbi:Coiled-coil and C2 domain-containing protein 2A [Branchiostoma belcheri]|nr:Coiled-coil and C2 domain-containing protein 2A [Branchiostoma belcheri]